MAKETEGAQPSQYDKTFILGAGAVGLFLGWDLLQGKASKHPPVFYTRSPVPQERRIHFSGKSFAYSPQISTLCADDLTAEAEVKSLSKRTALLEAPLFTKRSALFVCIPCSELHNALQDIRRILQNQKQCHWDLLICSNGIVAKEILASLRELLKEHPGSRYIRALVYAGFQKSTTSQRVEVQHNGGQLIRYGFPNLGNTLKDPVEISPFDTNLAFFKRTKHLQWKFESNIEKIEVAKLFLNLTLALGIGNRMLTNGTIYSLISAESLSAWAEGFAKVFADQNLKASELLEILHETVDQTAQNVNSISQAWIRGDKAPLIALLSPLAEGDSHAILTRCWPFSSTLLQTLNDSQ
jgi:ketopantoate reductase